MAKKAARKTRAKKTTARKTTPRKSPKQAIRDGIQAKFQKKLAAGVKVARELEKQNLGPDQIAAGVRAKLEGLSDEVVSDVLRLVGGSIHVQMP